MSSRTAALEVPMVSDEALIAALNAKLHLAHPEARVVRLERSPSRYRTSFGLEEITAHLDGGEVLPLLLKDVSAAGLHAAARSAKPAFLYDPLREIETYRRVLALRPLGTARLYGAEADATAGRFWLILERVAGIELYQIGDLGVWQEVARWLARLHAAFQGAPELPSLETQARLIRYDRRFYRRWMVRAKAFAWPAAGPAERARLTRLVNLHSRLLDRLLALPTTFIHGECYASNVLVQDVEGDMPRVCPVDWEMAALGPGLIDLAALVSGSWSRSEKEAIARAYLIEARKSSRAWQDEDEFFTALAWCRLHVAVQWMGWSSDWSPPIEHAFDWADEAFGLVDYLDHR